MTKALGLVAFIAVLYLLYRYLRKGGVVNAAGPSATTIAGSAAGSDAAIAGAGDGPDHVNPGFAVMENPLTQFSQAIFQFESGMFSSNASNSIAVQNMNPGNLRSGPGMTGTANGYATFGSWTDGFSALNNYISNHAVQHPDWDFYDFFDNYLRGSTTAPSQDAQGNSDAYAEYVASIAGVDPLQTVSSYLGGQ